MLLLEKTGVQLMINVGTCPNCEEVVPFEPTEKEHIYTCPACKEKAKQYVNGKILYTKVMWNLEDDQQQD